MKKILIILFIIFIPKIVLGQMTEEMKKKRELYEKKYNIVLPEEQIYKFIGKKLPDFNLALLNGKKFNSENLKGKPTIINFWFIECHHCIKEMPVLNEIKKVFGNKVNFISVTYNKKDRVNEFIKYTKFKFTHLIDEPKEYLRKFGRFGYPKLLILDKNSTIVAVKGLLPSNDKDGKKKKKFKTDIINKIKEIKD